jgi:hypothetical protein
LLKKQGSRAGKPESQGRMLAGIASQSSASAAVRVGFPVGLGRIVLFFYHNAIPPFGRYTKKDPAPGRVKWQLPLGQII